MPYATQQDLIDRFGADELIQLTDREGLGAIDTTVIDRALGDADAEINSYLAARYTLPLSPVPTELVKLAADMARYQLYEDRVTEIVTQRYKDAIAKLKDISAGRAQLGIDDTSNKPVSNNSAQMTSATSAFKRSNKGFI